MKLEELIPATMVDYGLFKKGTAPLVVEAVPDQMVYNGMVYFLGHSGQQTSVKAC